jgi:hypothetical protein
MANLARTLKELTQERGRMAGQVRKFDQVISVLRKLAKGVGARIVRRPKRTMSAAARRRISIAQKARWAKWKAKQEKKAA